MNNVIISGTHTHGAPGGFMMHLLYDISILGFVAETKNALVHGITQSIINAHSKLQEGRIFLSEIQVENANINRSPTAYRNNPEFEKAQYVLR
jgi:neutral ceramidase